ncbi:uncharacterized protein N7500_010506 [Penicillium coprophilum]|uniref:uncharacterized protein n=1 Tax=Penicillium coprophilum TaxID=36646 RepID=UPI002396E948|nr:uncharacterized protein N7500_010506 [Penicillium coprophilum]KAJ5155067.1 hypothetical protein N7500_010506 [Penicillium coprophilum]
MSTLADVVNPEKPSGEDLHRKTATCLRTVPRFKVPPRYEIACIRDLSWLDSSSVIVFLGV